MIEEGVDAILIETCFDILQAKCVAITAIEEMKRAGVRLPLMVQLTIIDAQQEDAPRHGHPGGARSRSNRSTRST